MKQNILSLILITALGVVFVYAQQKSSEDFLKAIEKGKIEKTIQDKYVTCINQYKLVTCKTEYENDINQLNK